VSVVELIAMEFPHYAEICDLSLSVSTFTVEHQMVSPSFTIDLQSLFPR
jgi:hypothetical protein